MKKIIHKGKILDKKEGVSIIECISCGFKHVNPIPSEEELAKFYEEEFYSKGKPNYFKETKEDLSWWMATYNNYYTLLETYTKGRKILDVGSGPGHFLVCGKKRGWDVLGLEPSVDAWEYSKRRKLAVVNDFFSYESAKQYGPFDVIHASMVLEHVPNPATFIEDMKKLLKPNGIIAIFCPNDYNPLQEILQKKLKFKPWWVVPTHHLNYFDANSMGNLLSKTGFEVKESLSTFPMEFFLLSGKNYVKDSALGRECHRERKEFEMNLYRENSILLNSIYRTLGTQGIGREFIIIARKK
ncbi:MAG: SAM-dependent methyltransferase [Candidatus Yonathbacteria bacterium RBG_16_43_6]|uniref:SAM-dependent methyltransferase n=1 Tax=Candidatus Yonathbacteria bacterium RIFCSPLOWO2_01_FULL_43_27 TaxID=1802726 RepID=A0A1G2SBS8_9BACT|nr:MAG: SAM-dependent methyltransferase [Candidatus Yonathbacteria bacterium RBG_16_43_6]OHA82477.1 MAG: SAM-dependent methyltransferase [Candidatus Yonathbacteria bacterium RIFCSPLOWO2_01_FULL_43_27]